MIGEIRAMVATNAKAGYRFDSLVDRIQNRYSVTKNKAEFLAQNETSIYTSKVREQRFGDVGVTEYIWQSSTVASSSSPSRRSSIARLAVAAIRAKTSGAAASRVPSSLPC